MTGYIDIGDIVTGNALNTYGKTNELGQYKVLSVLNTLSVECIKHMDSTLIGIHFHGLDANQFDVVKKTATKPKAAATQSSTYGAESRPSSAYPLTHIYKDFSSVYVKKLQLYKSSKTEIFSGQKVKILSHDQYMGGYNSWECTVSYPDGTIGVMLECEMETTPTKVYTPSYASAKPDDDYWGDDPRKTPSKSYARVMEPVEEVKFTYPDSKPAKKTPTKNTTAPKAVERRSIQPGSKLLSTDNVDALDTSVLRRRKLKQLRTDY